MRDGMPVFCQVPPQAAGRHPAELQPRVASVRVPSVQPEMRSAPARVLRARLRPPPPLQCPFAAEPHSASADAIRELPLVCFGIRRASGLFLQVVASRKLARRARSLEYVQRSQAALAARSQPSEPEPAQSLFQPKEMLLPCSWKGAPR